MKITYAGQMNDAFVLRRKESDPLDAWFATDAAATEQHPVSAGNHSAQESVAAAPEWVPIVHEMQCPIHDDSRYEFKMKSGPIWEGNGRADTYNWSILYGCGYRAYRLIKPAATVGEWIEWKGGKCPVEAKVEVEYRCQNGGKYTGIAGNLRWDCTDDIIAYRLVSPS